jgi:death-on-curing family protein
MRANVPLHFALLPPTSYLIPSWRSYLDMTTEPLAASAAPVADKNEPVESPIAYLTTHDLVWINTVVLGEPSAYDYVTLEAVMAGQYSYGNSEDVPMQAAKMLRRLLAQKPFAQGNLRTAFLATLTFLNANGYATRVKDTEAVPFLLATAEGQMSPEQTIAELAAPAQAPLTGITLRRLITHECNLHVEALKILADHD